MGWYGVSGERLIYQGRTDRGAFIEWAKGREGTHAVAEVTPTVRFSVLGRWRVARRQLWRELNAAIADPELGSLLAEAAATYGRALADLAYAAELPRTTANLRRIVLVPRALVTGRVRTAVTARLARCIAYSRIRLALRPFVVDYMLRALDGAIRAARPSALRHVAASGQWVCVGVDTSCVWVDQIWSGPGWAGHFMVYERPASFSREESKKVERAVAKLQSSIQSSSRHRRQALAQAAAQV